MSHAKRKRGGEKTNQYSFVIVLMEFKSFLIHFWPILTSMLVSYAIVLIAALYRNFYILPDRGYEVSAKGPNLDPTFICEYFIVSGPHKCSFFSWLLGTLMPIDLFFDIPKLLLAILLILLIGICLNLGYVPPQRSGK